MVEFTKSRRRRIKMIVRQTIRLLFFLVVILISILLSAASWAPNKTNAHSLTPVNQDASFKTINPSFEWLWVVGSTPERYDVLEGMVEDKNGDVVVLFNSFDSGDSSFRFSDPSQIHISRYTKDGVLKWQITLETDTQSIVEEYSIEAGVAYSFADSIILDNAGNAFIVGTTNWSFTFIAKLDQNGSVLWNKHFDIPNHGGVDNFPANTATVDNDGNLYLVSNASDINSSLLGSDNTRIGNLFTQLTKVNPNGVIEWANPFAEYGWGNYDDFLEVESSVKTDNNGFIYVVSNAKEPWGQPITPFSGPRDISIAKFDNSGNLLWNTFAGVQLPSANGATSFDYIDIDSNNNILISGTSEQDWGNPIIPFSETQDGYLAKLDSNGNMLWNTFFGGIGYDLVSGIVLDDNNNIFILGNSPSTWGSPIDSSGEDFIAQFDGNSGVLLQNIFMDFDDFLIDLSFDSYIIGSADNNIYLLTSGEFFYKDKENEIYEISLDKLNLYGGYNKFRPPSIYVPDLTLYIPTPLDVSTDPKVVGTNVLLAIFLMLPFAVAVDIFSRIFSENEESLNKFAPIVWIGKLQKSLQNITANNTNKEGLRNMLGLLGVVAFYGLVFSLLDKTWNPLTIKGIFLFISMTFAFGLVGLLDDIIQWRMIRKWGYQSEFTVRPTNIFLAAISTSVSRILALVPGLMFGSPEALRINENELSETQKKTLVKISMFTFIIIGLTAWLPTIITAIIQQQNISENQKNIVGGIEALLLVIFAVALENIFVQLIGISEGLGQKIKSWNKWAWGISVALSAFAFLHTLLNPHYDFVSSLQQGNILVFISVSATFILITVLLNFYLRYRNRQKGI
jgi:hypothetical protein